MKKVLLMILDGWGVGRHDHSDAIGSTPTPRLSELANNNPRGLLYTSGENVGLPDGQMGNSEVGHLNIGAGRVVYQDLVKINRAIRDGSFGSVPGVASALEEAAKPGKRLHLMGLLSNGGVHSSMEHLFALCDLARERGVADAVVHCFMDGRDTDPRSGAAFVEALEKRLAGGPARVASIVGRYYAMDRDSRWERVKEAYDLLVRGQGTLATSAADAVRASYEEGVTDEFIRPIALADGEGKPLGTMRPGDAVIFFNFRNDRARELTIALTQEDKPEHGMKTLPLHYYTMTPYDARFEGLQVLFDKENVTNTIGEYISSLGLKQLRVAETEKYAHVTFFLNGGREAPFEGEKRVLVPSPKVATYDLQPEMSAPLIAERVVEELNRREADFACLNYANGDMVGHTGVYEAIRQAVATVDECVGKTVDAARANGYDVLIIADHGNADYAVNDDGSPNTAHSLNPVPCIWVTDPDNCDRLRDGVLADVAPTVLAIMGLPIPPEMTGRPLIA
ncbi:MAG: 2,3-bisphosphoglycerate-independent phosphoglycerate mutase [Odoribacteraceae bacterium]|jgi:2,3-bisphosphoglycerate-independent phosphoglycerate mutase|nr:2,3-bisphosphoglycerate-independent phosphoglycerate mutase [Odoribacteraceae bacterium]